MITKQGKTCVPIGQWEVLGALPLSIMIQSDNSSSILLMNVFSQFNSLGLASEAAGLCPGKRVVPAQSQGHTANVLCYQ